MASLPPILLAPLPSNTHYSNTGLKKKQVFLLFFLLLLQYKHFAALLKVVQWLKKRIEKLVPNAANNTGDDWLANQVIYTSLALL